MGAPFLIFGGITESRNLPVVWSVSRWHSVQPVVLDRQFLLEQSDLDARTLEFR